MNCKDIAGDMISSEIRSQLGDSSVVPFLDPTSARDKQGTS